MKYVCLGWEGKPEEALRAYYACGQTDPWHYSPPLLETDCHRLRFENPKLLTIG
jgi:hypothetical protein